MPRYEPPTTPGGGSSYTPHDPEPPHDPRAPGPSAGYSDPYPPYPSPYAEQPERYESYTQPGWSDDARWPTDPGHGRSGVVVRRLALVLGIALLICGAASVTGYLLLRDDAPPVAQTPSPEPSPGSSTAPAPGGTPLPQASTDVRFVVVGQCVRNDGDNDAPKLTITPCGPRTYEVLERFDGPTTGKDDARSKCSAVPGYTDWYFFDSPLDVLDYVLCLKSR